MTKYYDISEFDSTPLKPKAEAKKAVRTTKERSVMEADYNTDSLWELFKDRGLSGLNDIQNAPDWLIAKGLSLFGNKEAEGKLADIQNKRDKMWGVKGYVPKATELEQTAVAGAGEGLTDLLSYVPLGKVASGGKHLLFSALDGGVSGAAGAVGGEGGNDLGGVAMATTGGVLTAGATSLARSGTKAVADKVMPSLGKSKGEIDLQAEKSLQTIVGAAMAVNPALKQQIMDAVAASDRTGVKLPLSAIIGDNSVIISEIKRLAATDAKFRGQYATQLLEANKALSKAQNKTFGSVTNAQEQFNTMAVNNKIAETATKKKVEQRQQNYSKTIDAMSTRYSNASDPQELGTRISNLTDRLEKETRAELSPKYEQLIESAEQAGLKLKADDVGNLYNLVQQYGEDNLFQRMPTLATKLKEFFKAKETNSGQLDADGNPIVTKAFEDKSIRELDSLKREVRAEIRDLGKNPARGDQLPILMKIQELVLKGIDNVDPDFAKAYNAIDAEYRKRIGAVFKTETIEAMDRAKYAEQVVPKLTKNKSALAEFLAASGDKGKVIAEDAFLVDFEKAAIKDGKYNDKAARAFLTNNRSALALLPELRRELSDSTNAVTRVQVAKERLDKQFTAVAKKNLLSFEGTSPEAIVNNLYNNSTYRGQFLSQYGKDKDSLNAARAFMLDDIINSPTPLDTLFSDRKKTVAFNQMFGSSYAQRVQDLALVADRLVKDPTKVHFSVTHGLAKDPLHKATGVSAPEALSKLRDRFQSTTYALSAIASKVFTTKVDEARQEKIKQFLLNPNNAKQLLTYMEQVENGSGEAAMKALKMFSKHGLDIVKDTGKSMAKSAVIGGHAAYDIENDREAIYEKNQPEYYDVNEF